MAERAITLAGGLSDVRPGDSVFVKPNAVYAAPAGLPGVITAPAFVSALVSVLKDLGARVTVGDRSARGFGLTENVFRTTGLRDQALAGGADEVYPAPSPIEFPDAWVLVQPPHWEESWSQDGGILAMRKIVESDHLVIAPTQLCNWLLAAIDREADAARAGRPSGIVPIVVVEPRIFVRQRHQISGTRVIETRVPLFSRVEHLCHAIDRFDCGANGCEQGGGIDVNVRDLVVRDRKCPARAAVQQFASKLILDGEPALGPKDPIECD